MEAGERLNLDLKITFDRTHPASMLRLVKELVAMANAGGGTVRIGASETESPGVDASLLEILDSSRVQKEIDNFIAPAEASLSHSIKRLDNGKVIIDLTVEGRGKYPYIFAKDGQYTAGKVRNVFRAGDIYIRRGTTGKRAGYNEVVSLIDQAEERGRTRYLDHLKRMFEKMARLPEGTEPLVVGATPTGETAGTSDAVVDFALVRRRHGDRSVVLDGPTLLRCFLDREKMGLTNDRLGLLVRSALRRTPTLFHWLIQVNDRGRIGYILKSSLSDSDRDKSDVANNVLEVASIYMDHRDLEEILRKMENSRYAHIRNAALGWSGRKGYLESFVESVKTFTIDEQSIIDLPEKYVIRKAELLAEQILQEEARRSGKSRQMARLGRVILYRKILAGATEIEDDALRILRQNQ